MTDSTAWLLISTALVIFMTPGLAFFYGGLVKSKSVISMMMLSFGALGLISVLWILYGFNMGGLTGDGLGQLVGNPFSDFGLTDLATTPDVITDEASGAVSTLAADSPLAGVAFGGSFAIITVALISGSIADRARFWPWMLFAGIWATIVYFPVQAWVWNADHGWIYNFGDTGVLDWAGGTAVHINAGAAALALALVLGKRKVGFSKEEAQPHNVPLVLIGTAILWFGWFGFNTGLNTGNAGSGLIFLNTLGAPAAAMLGWIAVEHFKEGKATAVGAASGVVAGLVAITPACAHVTPVFALVLGLVAGAVCAFAIDLKFKLGFDDTLDVVGIHLVAGFIGCWYLGLLAYFPETGLFYGANADQLVAQVVCSVAVAVFSFVVAFVVGTAIDKTIGFRAKEEDEIAGIDLVLHGEGYAID
jgi:Amt family ammonium transporter